MSIKKILITGSRAPSTLHLIRCLKRAGFDIITAESSDFFLSEYSNCVSKNYKISSPKMNYDSFLQEIIEIIKNENIDLLIPTCEEIFYISKGKKLSKKYCEVFCDDFDKLIELHNKYSFYEKIKKSNYCVNLPESYLVKNADDLKKYCNDGEKYILKPVFSRFASKIKIFDKIPEKIDDGEYILQKFIEGESLCSYSVLKDGKILLYSDYKTEYKAGQGAAVAFSFEFNKKIYEFTKEFAEKENLTGQFAFDFIQNKDCLYLIECNPRLTSGICLFDRECSEAFTGNSGCETILPDKNKKSALKIALLIYALSNIKCPSDIIGYLKTIFCSKDVIFDKKDIKPFFMQLFILITMFVNAMKKHIDIKEISVYDIEWNGND